MLDIAYEYYFLKKMDTREDLEKTQNELRVYVAEAKRAKDEIENTKRQIDAMKQQVSEKYREFEREIDRVKRDIDPNNIFRHGR